jgi:hypothetical protein
MLAGQLDQAAPAVRAEVTRILDEISRPMTVPELDEAFRLAGYTRSERRRMMRGLRGVAIIALVAKRAP